MQAQRSTSSHQEQAFLMLARETDVSIGEVARLCTIEHARLALDARLTDYLPIFAFRTVQAVLRRRHATAREAA
jgi:hypothetical protein